MLHTKRIERKERTSLTGIKRLETPRKETMNKQKYWNYLLHNWRMHATVVERRDTHQSSVTRETQSPRINGTSTNCRSKRWTRCNSICMWEVKVKV